MRRLEPGRMVYVTTTEKIKRVLMKPWVKTIIVTILTTTISVLVGMLGNWDPNQHAFWGKVIGLVAVVILYITALIRYTTAEVNQRRSLEAQERQINAFSDLAINIIHACGTNAADITTCIHRAEETSQIDPNIWNFKKSSRALCGQIYTSLCNMGGSKACAVAYVALDEDTQHQDTVRMIAYANRNMTAPSIYNRQRRFADACGQGDTYHDLKLFCKGSQRGPGRANIDVRWGTEEVEEVFRYASQEEQIKHKGRYHAYVGIPVFCDDRKMVGLLEVVAMDDTKFGCLTKQELEEVADKLLVPYGNIFLLLHKMEKALFVGVK